MKSKIKNIVKLFVPPILLKLRREKIQYGWFGNYSTWQDASKYCTGYNADVVLAKCKASLLKIKNGEAVYERDSVVFDKKEYSFALLSGLLLCASRNKELHVLDFGGSLGSTYFQNQLFFSHIKNISWNIVEQPHFVECGKSIFQDDTLKFYHTVEECLGKNKINVLVLSSVLQYLENPKEWIRKFILLGIEYILIDRTSFIDKLKDIITIQNVPPSIYDASYPCWAFNENDFVSQFTSHYNILFDFEAMDKSNYEGMYFKGFFMQIKNELKDIK